MATYYEIMTAVKSSRSVVDEPINCGGSLFFPAQDDADYTELEWLADSIGGHAYLMSYKLGDRHTLKWVGYATDLIKIDPSALGMDFQRYIPDADNMLANIKSIVEDSEDIESVQAYIDNEIELIRSFEMCSDNEQVITCNGIFFDIMPIHTTKFEWNGEVCVLGILAEYDTISEIELMDISNECLARAILGEKPFNILEENIHKAYHNRPENIDSSRAIRNYLFELVKDMYKSDMQTDNEIKYFELKNKIL